MIQAKDVLFRFEGLAGDAIQATGQLTVAAHLTIHERVTSDNPDWRADAESHLRAAIQVKVYGEIRLESAQGVAGAGELMEIPEIIASMARSGQAAVRAELDKEGLGWIMDTPEWVDMNARLRDCLIFGAPLPGSQIVKWDK